MTYFLPRRLPRPRLHGRRPAGLSLLEMLLVIALIAAIGLITAAGLSRGFAGMQLRSAGKDIAAQKATYPAIHGLEKSRATARRLTRAAQRRGRARVQLKRHV